MPIVLTDEEKQRKFKFVRISREHKRGEDEDEIWIIPLWYFQNSDYNQEFTLEQLQNTDKFSDNQLNKIRKCKPGCAIILHESSVNQRGRVYALSTERHWNPEITCLQEREIELNRRNKELSNQITELVRNLRSEQGKVYRELKKLKKDLSKALLNKENKFADMYFS